jgi:hypothetical protein
MKHLFYFMEAMLLALLCSFNASGQNNFVPGYYINNSGDTIKCDVNFQDWETNPDHLKVRLSNEETRVYYPKDIKGFFIPPDSKYFTLNVSMDCTPHTTVDIYAKKEGAVVPDTLVFLQILVSGKMSLYYLRDINGKDHFYVEKSGMKPIELLVKKTLGVNDVSGNFTTYISTVNVYKGQLKSLMEDCPSIVERSMQIDYNEHDLVKIISQYNEKFGSPENLSVVKSSSKMKFKFGVLAGIDMISIKFAGQETQGLTKADFPYTLSFIAGGVFQMILPKNLSRVSINNELIVKPYYLKSDEVIINSVLLPNSHYEQFYSINAIYLKLNTLVRYTFSNWKVQPFLNAGISNGYAVKMETNNHEKVVKKGQVTSESDAPIIEEYKLYEFGAIFGLGTGFKNFGIEFRYEWSNGMSPYKTLTGNTNTFYLLLSYTF